MAKLLLTGAEQERVARVHERVEALGVSVAALAKQIGRSRQNVSGVVHGSIWSPGTLALIEGALDEVVCEEAPA